ncbi:hypothetical protein BU25DRAFT_424176 [Macroventuria anomochaeta]|uniref:Uncharacterized protein n=1 Tax=Macroventuria anomochaeta TaxID=301207 RepID=A0ACB6RSM4_9PLEO|nr:uncharacterized protein BU25DRAFT_424176 [Macroventuria anomochaeta]KAF2624400.1 hypothetical protein BU25DRAFT_424176 [Macroventuria anomochaeta]
MHQVLFPVTEHHITLPNHHTINLRANKHILSLRNTILTLLNQATRLASTRIRITRAKLNLLSKIATWRCLCRHVNPIYHLPSHVHSLGILACSGCDITWHHNISLLMPHPKSESEVEILLPDPEKPNTDAPYILPKPKKTGLHFFGEDECGGYGYIWLNERCGLT